MMTFGTGRREFIRRLAIGLGIIPVMMVAVPRSWSAPPSLALPAHDYPRGTLIAVPAPTNAAADLYLGPAHHSHFTRLHRIDGLGWVQTGIWHFKTGRGAASETHVTTFGYGLNVFSSHKRAVRALKDVKLKVRPIRVGKLHCRRFLSTDARETVRFYFFAYGTVEIEMYYEYHGAAPTRLATSLLHRFWRQTRDLSVIARKLHASLTRHPTALPTRTPAATVTASATETPTAAASPTAIPSDTATSVSTPESTTTPTPVPTATATSTASPTYTAAASGLVVEASMSSTTYAPGMSATLNVKVTHNGLPVSGVTIQATFYYPHQLQNCTMTTDASGTASCSRVVPNLSESAQARVEILASLPGGSSIYTSTSFQVTVRS
jgi:hypothetical protein